MLTQELLDTIQQVNPSLLREIAYLEYALLALFTPIARSTVTSDQSLVISSQVQQFERQKKYFRSISYNTNASTLFSKENSLVDDCAPDALPQNI